jgi:hypothetical protein
MHHIKKTIPDFLYLYFLLFLKTCPAAFDFIGVGAEPAALGHAMTANRSSLYAVYYNPANITLDREPLIELGYRSFYGLSFPVQTDLLINFPLSSVPLSICCIHLGDKIYREIHLALGSSYTSPGKISMGCSLNLYYLSIDGYSTSLRTGITIGFSYRLSDRFTMGVLITNVNQPKFSIINEKLPQTFALGWSYSPQQNIVLCCDLVRDVKYEQDYRAGVAITLLPQVSVRLGLEDKSNTCSMGLGLAIKKLKFDYAVVLHNTLGLSHVTSIQLGL